MKIITVHDRASITSRKMTDEGYLSVSARISRTGIYHYTRREVGLDGNPAELVRVYRPENEVFDQESMRSFAHKPVTDGHPKEGFVTAETFKQLAIGFSGNTVARDGDFVRLDILVTDATAIKKVMSGKSELSPGYGLELEMVAGKTPKGESYDAVQRKIRGNHVALVDAGRCGSQCRLDDHAPNVDGCEDPTNCECASCKTKTIQKEQKDMKTIIVDGVSYEGVQDNVADLIDRLSKAKKISDERATSLLDQLHDMAAKHNEKVTALDADIQKLKTATTPEAAARLADERITLITKATNFLDDNYDTTGKTNAQVARDVLARRFGAEHVSGKSDDWVLASFDTFTAMASNDADNGAGTYQSQGVQKQQRSNNDATGRVGYRSRTAQAWMNPEDRAAMNA